MLDTTAPVGQHAAYAHDDVTGRIVSFGGLLANNTVSGATYEFNLTSSTWRRIETTSGSGPSPRHQTAFGLIGRVLVVAGGVADTAGLFVSVAPCSLADAA